MSLFNPHNTPPEPIPELPLAPIIWLSQPAKRLYWTLQGPLSTSITVMPLDLNPDAPREAYFRQTLAGTTWHPISESPLTEPPVSSLQVKETNLRDWRDNWWTGNQEGYDEDDDEPEGEPPEFDLPLVVTASNGRYVTVHDYVTAVHPWLMEQREQILKARKVVEDDEYEAVGNERLLVQMNKPAEICAEDEDEWKEMLRKRFRKGWT
ncbi:hypothetical protein ONS95_005256 [Cadophora gregata]|uniref:uncharacterized protein n=1 Tax=Cadophora gregata TaxID=51156 RepID=UPI0026DC44B6|nr:uncharacterized protein ONS95_005256 [Cadophora gregata]KAK0103222.1 hypothetical protein ONS95_005256 [Cadophora gregata]KAK0107409.1 hypothetical protein ONS96_003228 [Cadophora gregata f. sp. sojae]